MYASSLHYCVHVLQFLFLETEIAFHLVFLFLKRVCVCRVEFDSNFIHNFDVPKLEKFYTLYRLASRSITFSHSLGSKIVNKYLWGKKDDGIGGTTEK